MIGNNKFSFTVKKNSSLNFKWISLVLMLLVSIVQAQTTDLLLHVSPASRMVTDPASVVIAGAPPGAEITLEATLTDRGGQAWSSRGVFYADKDGFVDVSEDFSLAGTYQGIDQEAIFWSMQPATLEELAAAGEDMDDIESPRRYPDFAHWSLPFEKRKAPVKIELRAEITGDLAYLNQIATAEHTVQFVKEGVKYIEVSEGDLRGAIYEAPGEGPHPLVMIVTGSGGAAYHGLGALLASSGITAFALAHFNYPGRPKYLLNMPLEYFSDAMEWFADKYNQERVALTGFSRGGEAVLLIASTFPKQVSALIPGVPVGMMFAGCCGENFSMGPAWTLNDKPLPYVNFEMTGSTSSDIWNGTVEYRKGFRDSLNFDYDDPRWIKVENIQSPILLISGDADALWPGSIGSERVLERLAAKGFKYPAHHLEYKGAGHAVNFPMLIKSRIDRIEKKGDSQLALGGTAEGNAFAQTDAFKKTVEFIKLYESAED